MAQAAFSHAARIVPSWCSTWRKPSTERKCTTVFFFFLLPRNCVSFCLGRPEEERRQGGLSLSITENVLKVCLAPNWEPPSRKFRETLWGGLLSYSCPYCRTSTPHVMSPRCIIHTAGTPRSAITANSATIRAPNLALRMDAVDLVYGVIFLLTSTVGFKQGFEVCFETKVL